jgi:hypothetical protein
MRTVDGLRQKIRRSVPDRFQRGIQRAISRHQNGVPFRYSSIAAMQDRGHPLLLTPAPLSSVGVPLFLPELLNYSYVSFEPPLGWIWLSRNCCCPSGVTPIGSAW